MTPSSLNVPRAIFVVSAIGGILAGLGGICTQTRYTCSSCSSPLTLIFSRTIPYENVTVFKFHGPSILIISSQEVNANICMFCKWPQREISRNFVLAQGTTFKSSLVWSFKLWWSSRWSSEPLCSSSRWIRSKSQISSTLSPCSAWFGSPQLCVHIS